MSERFAAGADQRPSPSVPCCLKILVESLKIFSRNKHLFFYIFSLLTFPLSLLVFSLALSSYPIKSQIFRLESVASLARTHFEARHVWIESREYALYLLRLKLLYFIPSYAFSLFAAITTVMSTYSAFNKQSITLKTAFAAVKPTWTRPLVTSIYIYVILLLYSGIPYMLAAVVGGSSPRLRLLIWVTGFVIEIYLMAVLGMGLVVSIVEKTFGWDAIRIGSGLMEGRRVSGWVISALLVLVTGAIGRRMEELTAIDSEDFLPDTRWSVMVLMEGWESAGLVCLYGVEVIFGFVVSTVYYCECRKRHIVRDIEENVDIL